ncbi:hypothetical protein HG536_0C02210 [Torulaspora globosa]|uniref:Uncharacterized protein n=1 Tax=Torulaspora globosa TaxID=48254 RepID=A0A7G3ZEW6_9SACH|nr:uncharacterized protein HG536_0C02210 [Torulaspora globosa]QLL32052.1 hypothetical protein HG536_0C02210 [Torulaspora globosa]
MAAGFSFAGELPIELPGRAPAAVEGKPEVVAARNACVSAIASDGGDVLSRIDVLLGYAGEILGLDGTEQALECEVAVAVVDVAYLEQELSLEMLERAYGSPLADSAWGSSGACLKRGVGLLQFVEQQHMQAFGAEARQNLFRLINTLKLELQFLQQMSVVVLSLSKLRSKVYSGRRDAVLDFRDHDVAQLATNSSLYAKLVIGCYNTATKCSASTVVNKPLVSYLNCLTFLLLSLDQYSKDQCGVALGMVDQAIRYLSQIVPADRLSDSILASRKKTDFLKNAIGKRTKNPRKTLRWIRRSRREELIPVLALTLDDFVIPLAQLLRYRYQQMNEKLAYQKVEADEATLRKLFPRGKAPELKGSQWFFNRETSRLQEVASPSAAAGYY